MRDPDLNGSGKLCLQRVGLVRAQGFRGGLRTEGLSSRGIPDLADSARVGNIKVRFQDALSPMVDPHMQELHAGGEAAGSQEPAHRQQDEGVLPLNFISIVHRSLSLMQHSRIIESYPVALFLFSGLAGNRSPALFQGRKSLI